MWNRSCIAIYVGYEPICANDSVVNDSTHDLKHAEKKPLIMGSILKYQEQKLVALPSTLGL